MRGEDTVLLKLTLAASAIVLASCSLVADFGQYTERDAAAPMDAGESDSGSTCGGAVCGSGESCCGNTCIPLGTLTDCGGCEDACEDGLNSDPVCMSGTCDATCDVGFGNCDDNVANGCEQALNVGEHCGGCGMACDDGDVCATVEGVTSCRSTCPAGEVECGRGCFDLDTSPLHCGDCNMRCRIPVGGGLPMCVDGVCADGCAAGMADCDGDPSDCEAALVTRYDDLDNDNFGDATAGFLTCPNEPFTADNAEDCDDTMMAVNPDADEVCDGLDNNCSDMTDDVPGLGEACACEPGADPGVLVCGTTDGAPVCMYPASESCNGFNDTCSGTADDDPSFVCALNERQACPLTALPSGCVPMGSQICEATCLGFGACVPTDLCNRMDDDCDDIVDEGAMALAPTPASLALGSDIAGLRAHLNPMSGQVGLIYASGSELRFATINPDGSAGVGPVMLAPSVLVTERGAGDVTWVGTHWVVGYVGLVSTTLQARAIVIGGDGSLGESATLPRDPVVDPVALRLDRIGTSNQALAVWTASAASKREIRDAVLTVDTTGAPSFDDEVLQGGGSSMVAWRDADVVSTNTGAFVAFIRDQGPGDATVFVGSSTGGLVGAGLEVLGLDARVEHDLELAFDRTDNQVGMVYRAEPSAGGSAGDIMLAAFGTSAATPTTRILQAAPARQRWSIAVANDGGFGVLYASGTGSVLRRFDTTNLSEWTSHTGLINVDQALIGLPVSDVRYLLFGNATAGAMVQPLQCD
ncbi:MAG: MopE-related protein [Sandaracinaceae bacterium]